MRRKRRFKKRNPYVTNMNIAFIFYMTTLVFLRFDSIARVLTLVIPLFAVYILSPSSKILRLHKKKKPEWASVGIKRNAPLLNPQVALVIIAVTTITIFFLRYDHVITTKIIQLIWGDIKTAYADIFGKSSANKLFSLRNIPVCTYYTFHILRSCVAFLLVAYSASVYFRYKQQTMFKKVLFNAAYHEDALQFIRELSWREFEEFIRELFNSLGYRATVTNYGPDGGKDIIMERDGIKVFAQCKHWKSDNVGVAIAREMVGVLEAEPEFKHVFLVTSGKFSNDAVLYSHRTSDRLTLMDGKMIADKLLLLRK